MLARDSTNCGYFCSLALLRSCYHGGGGGELIKVIEHVTFKIYRTTHESRSIINVFSADFFLFLLDHRFSQL